MMTEKWLVIDAHTHYLPQEAIGGAGVSGGFNYSALLKGNMSLPYARIQDIEGILRIMEDGGVDMAVLNNAAWGAQSLEVCKAINVYDNKYRINVYTRSHCPIYDIDQVRITQSYFARLEGENLTIVSPKL